MNSASDPTRTRRSVPGACRHVPPAAERARSIAARRGPVTIAVATRLGEPDPIPISPAPRHVHADGSISVVVSDDHALIGHLRAAPTQRLDAATELVDIAPTDLREPVRGLVWVNGSVRLLPPEAARAAAVEMAAADPDESLLDIGHGLGVVSVEPAFLAVADGDGTSGVDQAAFTAARADPLLGWETLWLRHLDSHHADVMARLARHLPAPVRGGWPRPAGIDRCGLRLRIEGAHTSHDVRLRFQRTADTPRAAIDEVHRLTGCQHRP